jgi:hypothetical protein
MPITNNIAWDERLEAFKGSGVNEYMTSAGAEASNCAECLQASNQGQRYALPRSTHPRSQVIPKGQISSAYGICSTSRLYPSGRIES